MYKLLTIYLFLIKEKEEKNGVLENGVRSKKKEKEKVRDCFLRVIGESKYESFSIFFVSKFK